jgi:hypothetical protein
MKKTVKKRGKRGPYNKDNGFWTKEKDAELLRLYKTMPAAAVAAIMGCSQDVVSQRCRKMGYRKDNRATKPWTTAELGHLAEIYATTALPDLARMFGRTEAACRQKANQMGAKLAREKRQEQKLIGNREPATTTTATGYQIEIVAPGHIVHRLCDTTPISRGISGRAPISRDHFGLSL